MAVTSKQIKLVFSYGFAIIVGMIELVVLFDLNDSTAWLATAFGLVSGWGAGILAAPYQSEQLRFKRIATVVAGFVSGWAVSKADELFKLWVDPNHGPLILEPLFVQRVLLCVTSFLLALVFTYVSRKYVSFGPGSEQPPPPKTA